MQAAAAHPDGGPAGRAADGHLAAAVVDVIGGDFGSLVGGLARLLGCLFGVVGPGGGIPSHRVGTARSGGQGAGHGSQGDFVFLGVFGVDLGPGDLLVAAAIVHPIY